MCLSGLHLADPHQPCNKPALQPAHPGRVSIKAQEADIPVGLLDERVHAGQPGVAPSGRFATSQAMRCVGLHCMWA